MPKKAAKKTAKKAVKKKTTRKPIKKAVKKTAKRAVKKVAKRAPKKKVAKKAAPKKQLGAIREPMRKTQIVAHIADDTGLAKKEVAAVFESLGNLIARHLKKGGAGSFTMPGLAKFRAVRKPATKARRGINPFTGEPTTFKAKPARILVKIRALKKLKDLL